MLESIVLLGILQEKNLDEWAKLKQECFSSDLKLVYQTINKHYKKYGELPSLEELKLTRNSQVYTSVSILENIEIPEGMDLTVAVDSLLDSYLQDLALDEIYKLVSNITNYDRDEVISKISHMALDLEESVHTDSHVYYATNIELVSEEQDRHFVPLGLNNTMDNIMTGAALTELVLVGGHRGSGKSVVCSNLQVNEYESGHVAPYFTIEMRAKQVFKRNMAMLAGISASNLRSGTLSDEEKTKLAKELCYQYENGESYLEEYFNNNNFFELQRRLKQATLKDINMPIIDNEALTLTDIDLNIQKMKTKYGDNMRMAIIDYINKIETGNPYEDVYDWKYQIRISNELKKMATRYNILIVSPYQVTETGKARFSRGIEDSIDVGLVLTAYPDKINFYTSKARDLPPFDVSSIMDWETLRISPEDAPEDDTPAPTDNDNNSKSSSDGSPKVRLENSKAMDV